MDDVTNYYSLPPQLPPGGAQPSALHASHYPYHQTLPPPAAQPSQHYLAHHPSTFASYGGPGSVQSGSYSDVRTLFIAGLPDDVKPREIYNLLREFPGYESSHLRSPTHNSQPFAFAVFSDQQSAITAKHALNSLNAINNETVAKIENHIVYVQKASTEKGMVFDLEKHSTLFIDLAKSNSRSKRTRSDDEKYSSEKKAKGSPFRRGTPDSGIGSYHLPGMGNSAHNMIGYPPAQRPVNEAAGANLSNTSPPNVQHNPACPTLFIANLGPSCTEQELTQIFSSCPGFLKLKMQSTYGAPVAFVDFQDTACSTAALNHLQGTILYSSSTNEGMRLEFAKSRMGRRKKSE